jgi:hypothetical protein
MSAPIYDPNPNAPVSGGNEYPGGISAQGGSPNDVQEPDLQGDSIDDLMQKNNTPDDDIFTDSVMNNQRQNPRDTEMGQPVGPNIGPSQTQLENDSVKMNAGDYIPSNHEEYFDEEIYEPVSIWSLLKDTVVVAVLFAVLSVPPVDSLIRSVVPESINNPYTIIAIKMILVAVVYFILKIFYL